MNHKYVDEQGEPIIIISSSIPGITFVPEGKTTEDAVSITKKQKDSLIRTLQVKSPPKDDNTKDRLDALQAELDDVKQKLNKKA